MIIIKNNVVAGSKLVLKKTSRIEGTNMHDVHFKSRSMLVGDKQKWFNCVKTGDCEGLICGIVEIHSLNEQELQNILVIAPVCVSESKISRHPRIHEIGWEK